MPDNISEPDITVSIVSHRHADYVAELLRDLEHCSRIATVIVTQNVPDRGFVVPEGLHGRFQLRENAEPKGFGANHNAALASCATPVLAILNPDLRLPEDIFPALRAMLDDRTVGIVAPTILGPDGSIEDSARIFPTPTNLLARLLGLRSGRYDRSADEAAISPDWVAGMFMMLPTDVFRRLGGFDERYFLYLEDVDLCARTRQAGYDVRLAQSVSAVHEAQRTSHRNPRYMAWHLLSMWTFFRRHWGRLPSRRQCAG